MNLFIFWFTGRIFKVLRAHKQKNADFGVKRGCDAYANRNPANDDKHIVIQVLGTL